ncbi:sulfite exporter TauE/SafE family protein [Photobacterium halotolerans]|uniref:Probable membrane transporter protein n=1 Tax=Photobacterium halotolerans TaxID=265726 RepID=A0A7X4WEX4_9GAMM|nr:sulfite exporter TauE/SafE family protein [Photobacterium halotolerans]NAW67494.1 TSUP family transporter [Photobacterium halotolerans]
MITLFFGAIAVGLSLGMLGSGGAILTVPILAYGLGQTEKQAIASALIIVGIISSITSFTGIRQRLVNWSLVMLFGFPGMAGTYLGAWFASYLDGAIQMTVFAVVMLAAAWRMFQPVGLTSSHAQTQSYWLTGLQGLLVGVLTGFVGVGGGFLIVPALVLLSGLTMQTAVATSLVIIVMNSLIGFLTYQDVLALTHTQLDWPVIAIMAVIGVAGSLAGQQLSGRLPQHRLQRIFSVCLILMAGFILYQSLPSLLPSMTL